MITEKTYKALTIIRDNKRLRASEFAQKMWGDTKTNMFVKVSNTGNGATAGKAAWLCAGSYIGRLKKMKLVHYGSLEGYDLTDKGREEIQEYEKKNQKIKIVRSVKNATGGWIHIDEKREQHFDLYCEGAHLYEFINGKPY